MGRPAKSAWMHELQGTTSEAAPAMSQHQGGRPVMPSYLPKVAQKEWRRIVKELQRRGTLTRVDASAIEIYVQTYAKWRACCEEIEKYGVMVDTFITDNHGELHSKRVQNPAAKLCVMYENSMRQMLKELGATPAARERTKKTQQPPPPTPPGQDSDPILNL